MDCLFCKIAAGEISSDKVYEDDKVYAFTDIAPAAPVHVLIIPKEHVMSGVNEAAPENSSIIGDIFVAAARIARELGLDSGFRVLTNVGEHGGQTVGHLHFHLIGGRVLSTDV